MTTIYVGGIYELEVETGAETKYYYFGSQWVAMRAGDDGDVRPAVVEGGRPARPDTFPRRPAGSVE